MKRTWNLAGIFAGIGMLLLIFDSKLALESAQAGLDLCLRTVIPSLFPFLVLSVLLTNSITGSFLQPIARLLGIPAEARGLLIPAFLGGYPVGAKCIHDLWRTGQISKRQAERLLGFCSNAGPAFLFGMLPGFFPEKKAVWLLWLIHILSAVLTGCVLSPAGSGSSEKKTEKAEPADFLYASMKAMGMICCWVILFRILVTFLARWFLWSLPAWLTVLITGMLELANGCCDLMQITEPQLRFVICSCMLSFGGVCVLLQTASVTRGLSLRYYLRGKIMQTAFSLLLSGALLWTHGWLPVTAIPVLLVFLRKIQKSSGNPGTVPV